MATANDVQRLYGLVVSCDSPLRQDRAVEGDVEPDVAVRTGRPVASNPDVPPGDVLIDNVADGRRWYSAARAADGSYVLRFDGVCEFEISADLRDVIVHSVRGADPALTSVFTTGAMLAFQLHLRGHTVLHASAVTDPEGAVAFVGSSGMGKSTMAALLCADGGRLVTDDVLRVDGVADGAPVARLGATELRLRQGADTLAERFDPVAGGPGRRRSADGRELLRLPGAALDREPLRALVIPRPTREAGAEVRLDRLEPPAAIFALVNFPRLLGWRDADMVGRQFSQVVELARQVPVFLAQVPWGPPFAPGIARAVRSAALDSGRRVTV